MFTGSIVALITPMREKGDVCFSSLKKLIDYHIMNGTSSIVSVGTTGESMTLTQKEHRDIVNMTIKLADGRIPIIAGITNSNMSESIKLIQSFNEIGIIGYLIGTPYYSLPSQEGLFQYFKVISEHTNLPIILYNVPFRTGCDLLPETIGRLAKIKNITGIKDASKNLSRVHQIKEVVSEDFILLSGDDVTSLDFMQLGGHGVISVTANVAARKTSEICQLASSGYYQEARILNRKLTPLYNKLFIEPNPIPVKWACKKLGLISTDISRLPMIPITKHGRIAVNSALKYANLL